MEDFDLSGYTLFEKQSKFYNGNSCPYCFGLTDLIDSIKVYRESHGLIYYCDKCQAWCGTHKNANNNNDQSLGCVAKKTLRDIRHECHKWFEPLVVIKMNKDGVSKRKAKAAAYNWLAKVLNIDPIESHIGYFNIAQCKKVIDACIAVYPTEDMIKKREADIKWNCDVFLFNAADYNLEVKEFRIMNLLHLEVKHTPSGKFGKYDPKKNEFCWSGKKKWLGVGDIELFLEKHFK